MRCSQCNKPAMYEIQGHSLCLDHYAVFMNIHLRQQSERAAMIDYLGEQIEYTMGVRNTPPKLHKPQPIINQTGPVNVHNIKVDRSIVGTINTGTINSLNNSLSHIQQGGNKDLAVALKILAEAIANAQELQQQQRQEALELVAFLGEQASEKPGSRKDNLVKKILTKQMPTFVNLSASLMTIWPKIEPIISSQFNLD